MSPLARARIMRPLLCPVAAQPSRPPTSSNASAPMRAGGRDGKNLRQTQVLTQRRRP